ncbi:MAG: thiamine pyrophosphate-dependent enzyme, partial [Thermoplasmata archaeon]
KKVMGVSYVMYIAKKYFAGYTIVDESISSSYVVRSIFGYGYNRYFTAKSGQLGWANAASLGIAMHSNKVLEIVGDGAFMYTIQSLWTAKKYHLPVKYLVLNNGGYNILKSFAKSYYPELENAEYLTLNLDIENIVKGFGIDVMVAGADLKEIEWLKEGDYAKVLVVNVDKTVPKLFL